MFSLESEMTPLVDRWLQRQGMVTRSEFYLPWGVVDLVGIAIDSSQNQKRLSFGQKGRIGSLARASVLLNLPDYDEGRGKSLRSLHKDFMGLIPMSKLDEDLELLIKKRFVVRSSPKKYAKLNGWMPLQEKLIAVELKLDRVQDVIAQAVANKGLTENSYIALPYSKAKRVLAGSVPANISESGIGVIGVLSNRCIEMVEPSIMHKAEESAVQLHAVDRLWQHTL